MSQMSLKQSQVRSLPYKVIDEKKKVIKLQITQRLFFTV